MFFNEVVPLMKSIISVKINGLLLLFLVGLRRVINDIVLLAVALKDQDT